ncbi:MAG: histidine ammonia-lyase [Candidatus Zixiibacteriota bacterium]
MDFALSGSVSARGGASPSRAVVETLLKRDVKVYGITTGFASLRDKRISPEQAGRLSENLIRTHACGVGEPFGEDVVRAAMFVRAHTFSLGCSGVTERLADRLIQALNEKVYPFVPSQGSVGSSGDLAPLSHLFLALIGDPDGMIHRRSVEPGFGAGVTAIERGGAYISQARREDFVSLAEIRSQTSLTLLTPYALQAKEGLAATNSALFATVVAALAAYDAESLLVSSELIAALSFEALQASPDCLDEKITSSRPYAGHVTSAGNMRAALTGSDLSPDFTISGFNMARYNQALIALSSLCSESAQAGDIAAASTLEGLATLMRERQRQIQDELREARMTRAQPGGTGDDTRTRNRELERCSQVFASVREAWEHLLGWTSATGAREHHSELTPGLQKDLSRIYHERVDRVVRPVGDPDVQDNYSFRASPTVFGAARDSLAHTMKAIEIEINSATDNPLIMLDELLEASGADAANPPEEKAFRAWLAENWPLAADNVVSAANFHGEPIGLAADYLASALSEIGNVSERRLAVLTDHDHSKGLPAYLIWNPGLNSGLMLLQYVAASLASENKTLAVPATTDSIPTGESCEDHNSMATLASRKLARIVGNVENIVAIELLAAYQGAQFRKPARLGELTSRLEALVADSLSATLLRLSGWSSLMDMRNALRELGLSDAATDSIQPCVVDDVTIYPLVDIVSTLVRSGAVKALAGKK